MIKREGVSPTLSLSRKIIKEGKEEYYDKTRNFEVDAADYSVGDYGHSHGTGNYQLYGYVAKRASDSFGCPFSFIHLHKLADIS